MKGFLIVINAGVAVWMFGLAAKHHDAGTWWLFSLCLVIGIFDIVTAVKLYLELMEEPR